MNAVSSRAVAVWRVWFSCPQQAQKVRTPLRGPLTSELAEIGFISPGSLVVRSISCGKPNCRCRADPPQRHGLYCQWGRAVAAKTESRRFDEPEAGLYRQWIGNRRHLEQIITRMETLSVAAGEILLREATARQP